MSEDIETLELKISKFLRLGVLCAAIFMLIGWILQFHWYGNPFFHFEIYDQVSFSHQLIFHYQRGHWGHLLSFFGLIILISLPLIRVLLTAILFLRQKERALAFIAFLVLMGLMVSFTFGIEL